MAQLNADTLTATLDKLLDTDSDDAEDDPSSDFESCLKNDGDMATFMSLNMKAIIFK